MTGHPVVLVQSMWRTGKPPLLMRQTRGISLSACLLVAGETHLIGVYQSTNQRLADGPPEAPAELAAEPELGWAGLG